MQGFLDPFYLKDNLPHNTYQIHVKHHPKNTEMTGEYQIFDEKALELARLFSGFSIANHFHEGVHGGSHWIARSLLEIGHVYMEE